MCGITAMFRFDGSGVDERQLNAMCDEIFHRGPDDSGTHIDGHVGLGFRRLSIIDLSPAGHQPMTNEDRTVWIVFNGEIYNYVELRADLISRGHRFTSHTDTETIIHLWEEEGERCVQKLRGMFGFVIWDSRRKVFFGARDRIGIKPFHYYADARQFVCGSEIKSILEAGVPRAVDNLALADYVFSGYPQGGRTLFSNIKQLPPGHSITVTADGVRTQKYWDIEYAYNHTRSDADVDAQLASLLDEAVRIHCRSDAELGCHLSGGLDSSTVTGLASRHRASMKAFSIRFGEGGFYDETEFAKAQAAHSGAEYLEAVPDVNDFNACLPGLLWHLELPLPTGGGFGYYTVSRLAAKHVKVTLTGHGGDEVFAGYPAQFMTAFGTNPFPQVGEPTDGSTRSAYTHARAFAEKIARLGVRGVADRIKNRISPRQRSPEEMWIALHCGSSLDQRLALDPRFLANLNGYSPVDDYISAFREAQTNEVLDRCLYHDLRCYLPGLLHMEDRVSMSVSVESRVPLLDHRLIEFMATVPPAQKVRGMQPKALLRAAAKDVIPPIIRDRKDKRPFPVPFKVWVENSLAPLARGILQSERTLDRGFLNADRARRWDLSHGDIWSALNVELWFRIFIDRDPQYLEQAKTLRMHGPPR